MARQSVLHSILTRGLAALAACGLCLGQVPPNSRTNTVNGTTPPTMAPGAPAGTYHLSDFEQVNVYNGHLNVSLPLLAIGGRGSAGFSLKVGISQPKWSVDKATQYQAGNAGSNVPQQLQDAFAKTPDLVIEQPYGPGVVYLQRAGSGARECTEGSGYAYGQTFSHLVFRDADGTEHGLYDTKNLGIVSNPCPETTLRDFVRGLTFASRDGSGMTFVADSTTANQNNLVDVTTPWSEPDAGGLDRPLRPPHAPGRHAVPGRGEPDPQHARPQRQRGDVRLRGGVHHRRAGLQHERGEDDH